LIFTISGPHYGKSAACEPVLRGLPDWFGIEEAIVHYAAEIDALPTFLASTPEGVIGFLSLKQHNPYAAEILVMGVKEEAHRQGTGRALVGDAEKWLLAQSAEYLQVKTLGPSHPDPGYAHTRAFYLALGFRPLEEFRQIWDEHNPCLILVKRLTISPSLQGRGQGDR
jgi:GNAT superfamily N-acetyltransferase